MEVRFGNGAGERFQGVKPLSIKKGSCIFEAHTKGALFCPSERGQPRISRCKAKD